MATWTPVGEATLMYTDLPWNTHAAMAPVYAVPTVHVEDLSRDLWSWASVRMIDGEETLAR